MMQRWRSARSQAGQATFTLVIVVVVVAIAVVLLAMTTNAPGSNADPLGKIKRTALVSETFDKSSRFVLAFQSSMNS